jgi:hypothetical protein
MEAFELSSGTKDYGSAASQFASNVSTKNADSDETVKDVEAKIESKAEKKAQ